MKPASWTSENAEEFGDEVQYRVSPAGRWAVASQTFGKFCKEGQDMDGKSFAKLCRDCHLLDKHFNPTDPDLVFAKVVDKGQRRINLDQFVSALRIVAEKKGVEIDAVYGCLQRAAPVLRSTKAEAVRFHDDSSLYTGTHRYGGPEAGAKGGGSIQFLSLFRDGAPTRQTTSASSTSQPASDSTPAHGRGEGAETGRQQADARSPRSPGQHGGTPTSTPDALEASFRNYCQGFTPSATDSVQRGPFHMDGKSFAKLCKDCGFVGERLPTYQVDILFAKVLSATRGQRRMNFDQFLDALSYVAQKLERPFDSVCRTVEDLSGPTPHQHCTQAGPVRLHDDITTYTGMHKRAGSTGSACLPIMEVDTCSLSELMALDDDTSSVSTHCGSRQFSKGFSEQASSVASTISSRAVSPGQWRTDRGRSSSPAAAISGLSNDRTVMDPRHKSVRTRLAPASSAGNTRRAPPQGEVTLVLADVQECDKLWEACPKGMRQAMRLYSKLVRDVLATWDGHEMPTEGDSFLIAFTDSLDAVGFCLEVQLALLREVAWPPELLSHPAAAASADNSWGGLRVKMAVHTGESTMTKDEVTGRPIYGGQMMRITKAIEGAAHGGQILVSAQSFTLVDGLLVKLNSPQVVDLGTHVLTSRGSGREDASRNSLEVHLLQLVPQELAFDYFSISPASCSGKRCPGLSTTSAGTKEPAHSSIPGRIFAPIKTLRRVDPGFHESPSGSRVTMCFVFTQGAKDLTARVPDLAVGVLRMLRNCVRAALRTASKSGYECQEDDGAFMLAFQTVEDAADFAVELQSNLPFLTWPRELRDHSPRFGSGLKVQVGIIEGTYTSRGPHTTTGRADYFGPIVNRAARVAAASHPGQVLIGEADDAELPIGLHQGVKRKTQAPGGTQDPTPVGSIWRLGAFALKGIEKPLGLWELRIRSPTGTMETFPEPKTRGRVGN